MPVLASSRMANLRRSLEVYLDANLSSGYSIDYEGVPFNDDGLAEWIQVRLLGPIRGAFYRQVSREARGEQWMLIVNANLFVRPAMQTVAHRLYQIRDAVFSLMTERTRIVVKDYEGNSMTLGYLIVRGFSMDRQVTDPAVGDALRQWTIAPELEWIGEWT